VHAEHAAKFADRSIEHPTCVVPPFCAEDDDALVFTLDRGQEFSARRQHSPQALRKFLCAFQVAKLASQELANSQDRFNAIVRNLHLGRHKQDPTIFEKCEESPRDNGLCFRRIPLHTEDRDAEPRDSRKDFGESHVVTR